MSTSTSKRAINNDEKSVADRQGHIVRRKQPQRKKCLNTNQWIVILGSYLFLLYLLNIYKSFHEVERGDELATNRGPRMPHMKKNKPGPPTKIKVLHDAPTELRLPTPIINVGFPKAGTSSIFSFFHCNGLKAQHWFCCERQRDPKRTKHNNLMSRCIIENLIVGSPMLENCGDYDVYTEINGPRKFEEFDHRTLLEDGRLLSVADSNLLNARLFFPQHHHLDNIHRDYPNATLILNQRHVASWINSIQEWNIGLQFEILNEFLEQNSTSFLFDGTEKGMYRRAKKDDNTDNDGLDPKASFHKPHQRGSNFGKDLQIVYEYHIQYVRDWVARYPSHALVEVDIKDEDAGKILAEAFGLDGDCWGHFNENVKGSNRKHQKKMAVSGGHEISWSDPAAARHKAAIAGVEAKKKHKHQVAEKIYEKHRRRHQMKVHKGKRIIRMNQGKLPNKTVEINIRESLMSESGVF